MKKLLLAVLSLLFVLAPAYALEFSSNSMALCATDTAVFVASVTNDGNFQDSYTVSLSGDAAKWAVAAPAGFSLNQGESEQIYVYVTPSIIALAGDYSIKATVSSVGKTEEQTLGIKVLDCHSAELTVAESSKDICAATRADYSLQLKNTGKYTENFAISVNGVPAKFSILSEDLVTLTAGQTKDINLYSTPPADQTGDFALTVTAASQNSKATASQQLQLKSRQCYDFNAKPDVNYLSFCEASEAKIPIAIENAGSVDNVYTLSVDGPAWATVENTKVEVPAGQARFTNLVLFPSYGIAGDFSVKVTIAPDNGIKTEQTVIANVKTCNSADVKISETDDMICPNTEKAYAVSLVNTGQFDARYSILVQGADFASSDKSFADLKAGEATSFNLIVAPKGGAETGKQTITVTAEAQDASKATASSELNLEVASLESCFGVETTSALTSIDVAAGEPALVPIVIENKGVENSTYNLEVSGTGAAFVQLNPASLTLEGKSSKTVYAYVAVPEGTAKDSYKVTVAARLKDQATTMSTTSFDIVLSKETNATEKPITSAAPVSERFAAIKDKIVGWWNSLVAKVKSFFAKEAPATTEEQPVVNESGENVSEPVIEAEENITPTENITEAAENETAPAENVTLPENVTVTNETNETAPVVQEENQTTAATNETNETVLTENASGLLSAALQAKLAEAKNETVQEESTKERFVSNLGSLGGAFSTITAFLTATTYFIPNWLFIVLVIVIVAFANYLLRRKDLVNKFNKFLDEDTEAPKEEKKNGNGKKPTAQDILDAEEKKKNSKKK
jgi:uncharacterized membrane protein